VVNGIFKLNPAPEAVFTELARVVRQKRSARQLPSAWRTLSRLSGRDFQAEPFHDPRHKTQGFLPTA